MQIEIFFFFIGYFQIWRVIEAPDEVKKKKKKERKKEIAYAIDYTSTGRGAEW